MSKASVGWSVVSLPQLQHSAALYTYLPQLWNSPLNFPYDIPYDMPNQTPLAHIQPYPTIKGLKLVISIFFFGPVIMLQWLALIPTLQLPELQL